ncbi:MAG: cobalamin biosynthesis protein CbiM [Clostridia bacterium]|nr:MAG: cobalamin biosynthesis protein CbiM [Clostridia bacterium]
MHIPDGLLTTPTWATTAVVSAGYLGGAVRKLQHQAGERLVPYLGVMGAFIFAAQMLNFPVAGGTSGHLIGAALAAMLFGPWAASILVTVILVIQALVFFDGGLTALGANILNMAIVAPWTGYIVFKLLSRSRLGIFLASWLSVLAAALVASLELAASGLAPLGVILAPMLGWHFLIGLGEGLITTVAYHYLSATVPEIQQGVSRVEEGGI